MDEGQALAALHEILARPEYQLDRSVPWWQQLLSPVADSVWSALARLAQIALDSASGREGLYGLGVLAVCVLLLAIVASYLIRAVRLTMVGETQAGRASLTRRRERSDRLWQMAQQAAAAGQHAEAIRLSYLSVLYALDERALLPVESSLTNREHAERLRSLHPSLSDGFSRLVDQYDKVRYGAAPVSAAVFEDFRSRVQQVRGAAVSDLVA